MFRILIMEISDRIKQRLNLLGLKSVDIIRATGVTSGGVSQWVSGATKPKGEKLLIIAKLLKCSPEWLISGRGDVDQDSSSTSGVPILTVAQARVFLNSKELPVKYEVIPELMPGTSHVAFGLAEESEQFEPAIIKGAIYYVLPMAAVAISKLPGRLLAAWVNDHIIVGRMKSLAMGQIALLMPDKTEVVLESGKEQVIGLVTNIHNP